MDPIARNRLLSTPWQPHTYSPQELSEILKISPIQAIRIVLDCNAGDMGDQPWPYFVCHHDLTQYLRDLITPVEVPDGNEGLSVHGKWLLTQSWQIDYSRTNYRWVDPNDPTSHYMMKAALAIALSRMRPRPPAKPDPNIIDAEFSVRT